ncbi:MAG: phosphate signaling complex protein PhoU [Chthonomonadales bacterium]|nr:phosphate signaling complex protein PhoU [Chthonomonadales bacterium]
MSSTRTPFDEELSRLRTHVLAMGETLDHMLDLSMQALTGQDPELTKAVLAADDEVDRLDAEIEADCLRMIALQQPVASDLRKLGTAFKVVTDLERIGDYAVDIAKIGRRISRRGLFYKPLVDMPRLAGLVRAMLRDVMSAFVNQDLDVVARVVTADDEVDDLYHRYRDFVIEAMRQDTTQVYVGTFVVLAAKYLERVGDHLVNVAERIHYMVTGDLVQLAKQRKLSAQSEQATGQA